MDFDLENRLHKLEDWTLDTIVRCRKEIERLENDNKKLKEDNLFLKEKLSEYQEHI